MFDKFSLVHYISIDVPICPGPHAELDISLVTKLERGNILPGLAVAVWHDPRKTELFVDGKFEARCLKSLHNYIFGIAHLQCAVSIIKVDYAGHKRTCVLFENSLKLFFHALSSKYMLEFVNRPCKGLTFFVCLCSLLN